MTCAACGTATPEPTSRRCRACYLRTVRPSERITHAALMVNGELWSLPAPARHNHLIHAWSSSRPRVNGAPAFCNPESFGFLTSSGRYVERREAKDIAEAAGQVLNIPGRSSQLPELYSEDVW